MLKVKDLLNEHKSKLEGLDNTLVSQVSEDLEGYVSGFFEDAYKEAIESNVDIYNKDLLQWLSEYVYEFETYMSENEPMEQFDLYASIRNAQFYYYQSLVLDNEKDVFMVYVYNYILNELKVEEINEEQFEEIKNAYSIYTDLGELRQDIKTLLKGEK